MLSPLAIKILRSCKGDAISLPYDSSQRAAEVQLEMMGLIVRGYEDDQPTAQITDAGNAALSVHQTTEQPRRGDHSAAPCDALSAEHAKRYGLDCDYVSVENCAFRGTPDCCTADQSKGFQQKMQDSKGPISDLTLTANFRRELHGAVVATIRQTPDEIVEVQRMEDGSYQLIVHQRRADSDCWDDCTATLTLRDFAVLGSITS